MTIDIVRVRRGDALLAGALGMTPPPRALDAESLAAMMTEDETMEHDDTTQPFQIRAPRALVARIDALVGRLGHIPECAVGRQTKSLVTRVALARGLTELEREAAKAERAAKREEGE